MPTPDDPPADAATATGTGSPPVGPPAQEAAQPDGSTAERDGSTAEGGGSTAERDGSTAEGGGSTAERDGGTAERGGGTAERGGGTAQRDGGTAQRDGGTAQRDGGTAQRDGGTAEGGGGDGRRANGFATMALVCGILGVTGLGIVLALLFGALGLVRARRRRSGKVRCWLGIAAALLWAVPWVFFTVHAVKAADPGCTAYKGPALTRYNRAIESFDSQQNSARIVADFKIAITALRAAADQSQDPASHSALDTLTRQLGKALTDEEAGQVPPAPVMRTLNHDVAQADAACGTL